MDGECCDSPSIYQPADRAAGGSLKITTHRGRTLHLKALAKQGWLMNWRDLPLREKHELLTRLRAAVVLLTLGDTGIVDQLIGDIVPADDPLPDSAGVADAVDAWLAGGAA